jgi:hypothetical protein
MTAEELAAIEARANAATQWADGASTGEWRAEAIGPFGWAVQRLSKGEHRDEDAWVNLCWVDKTNAQPVMGRAHADFIAAARTDVPALLAEVDRLEAERDAQRAATVGAQNICAIVQAERDAAQRALAEANEQIAALRAWSSPTALAEAQARNVALERAIKFAVSACYCDDRDGNCNPPESPWCDRCKRLSAAIEAPADDAALREFGLRVGRETMRAYHVGKSNDVATDAVDAVLRGES